MQFTLIELKISCPLNEKLLKNVTSYFFHPWLRISVDQVSIWLHIILQLRAKWQI